MLIVAPLVGSVFVFVPGALLKPRHAALLATFVSVVLCAFALVKFYQMAPQTVSQHNDFVLMEHMPWFGGIDPRGLEDEVYLPYFVGADGISIWMIALTSFLMPLVVLGSFTAVKDREREYYALLLLLQAGLVGVFSALNLILFYVFFEFTLIPLYFLIGIWGGADRRRAANKFFIYTIAGSVLTLAGILFLGYYTYTNTIPNHITFDFRKLVNMAVETGMPMHVQIWLFLAFAAGFAIKVPLFPVHTWLPLAHTEAPTAGSVMLAGVLLKLGTYGFCRISLPILPDASAVLGPYVAALAIIGIIYAALAAWVQRDVKKLVAYSSVSHLGFCMLGLFSLKVAGVTGATIYMINHGLSTGALFLVIGMMYERYHTRSIDDVGGLAKKMPILAFFLVFFTLSSIGLPGLNGFIGEFLVLLGTATSPQMDDGRFAGPLGYAYAVPAAIGIILGAVYMLWMCRCVLFGPLKEPAGTPDLSAGLSKDLNRREVGILVPIAVCCVVLGVYPKPLLETFEIATRQHILVTDELFRLAETGGTTGGDELADATPSAVDEVDRPSSNQASSSAMEPETGLAAAKLSGTLPPAAMMFAPIAADLPGTSPAPEGAHGY